MSEGTLRQPRIVHQAAGAVVIDDGRLLLLRRGLTWIFPKGHLEKGEQPQDAAVREVREETGLDIEIDQYLGTTRHAFEQSGLANTKRVDWYVGHPIGGHLLVDPEFEEAAYATLSDALSRLTFEGDREIADRAATGMGAAG